MKKGACVKQFGPRLWLPFVSETCPVPIRWRCAECDEGFERTDFGLMMPYSGGEGDDRTEIALLRECFIRQTVGSVAHQEGRCQCHGGTETDEDDPTISKREAARRAEAHWERQRAAALRQQRF